MESGKEGNVIRQNIFELIDRGDKSWIKDRLNEVKKDQDTSTEILFLSKDIVDFISDKTEIHPNMMFDGFLMDDNSVYETMVDTLIDWKKKYGKSAAESMPQAILATVCEYFGNYQTYKGKERKEFYMDKSKSFSISELKGKEIAECIEKAALTHNILKFLGYDTELVLGHLSGEDNVKEPHAYNLIKGKKGTFLLDITNPIYVYDENDKFIAYVPYVGKVDDVNFTEIKVKAVDKILTSENQYKEKSVYERTYFKSSR